MRRPVAAALLLALAVAGCAPAPPMSLRVSTADEPLRARVAALARKAGCRFGIVAVHIPSGRSLAWNEGEEFEGASLIKLALLTEAVARVKEERLDLTDRWRLTERAKAAPSSTLTDLFDGGLEPTWRDLLRLMISISDNTATNAFIDRFGAEAVNARMEHLGFPHLRLLGRIPDREGADKLERWPPLGSMTPAETAEWLRRVATGTLLDPESDRLVVSFLKLQRYRERIPRLLLSRPGFSWAGKTGTMFAVRCDAGLLATPRGTFAFAMFADRFPDVEGARPKANETMGEIARAIVDAWWPSLPELPAPPVEPAPEARPGFSLSRARLTLEEAERSEALGLERVLRDEDRRFWQAWTLAGGEARDACLVPSPSSWWDGDLPFKIEPVGAIVLHHTSMPTDEECLATFEEPRSKVSAHFLVGRAGRLYQFVSLEHRSWHAGLSLLHGRRALNRWSIGIEITGSGNEYAYEPAQIDTVARLVGILVAMYDVESPWIVGHQHVSPERKTDPGELFPWNDVVRRALELADRLRPRETAGP